MVAHANIFQNLFFLKHPINKQPIRFDVAFPVSFPVADQGMIPIFRGWCFPMYQQGMDSLEFFHILAALPAKFHIAPEARGFNDGIHLIIQICKKILGTTEAFSATPFQLLHRFERGGVRSLCGGLKGQPAPVYRLLQEQPDSIRRAQAHRRKNGICLLFQLGLDAGLYQNIGHNHSVYNSFCII